MLNSEICFFGKHNSQMNIFIPHKHDFYEVVYFLKGKGRAIIADREYEVVAHRYCIIPPHTEHVELLEEDAEILFVGFKLKQEILPQSIRFQKDESTRALSMLESIVDEYKNQRTGYTEAAAAYLQLFLIAFLRKNTKDSVECRDLHYIKTYLEQYYGQRINFRDVSAMAGYSYDYFRHIFKQTYGVSPQKYLVNIRLEHAKVMLENTDLTCTQVASHCGFSNSAQMSAMIKREFGLTPSQIKSQSV